MQLTPPARPSALRARLRAAACLLLASGTPVLAHADASTPTNQLDASGLVYGEASRTTVVEPMARITRLYADGQSLSAQFGLDVITGSSPTGQMPTGRVPLGAVQTTTSSSGGGGGSAPDPGQIPLAHFQDVRAALDADWTRPLGWLTPTLGGHFSREKDYQSVGGDGKLSVDLMRKLTTVTVGGGFNHDDVFPVGGVRLALGDGTQRTGETRLPKEVVSGMVGVSRVLTRRWLVGVNATRTYEHGYLTDPYKLVSQFGADSGYTVSAFTEKRPARRDRRDVLVTSVYQFHDDVIHLSYRYYWDDWKVRSHTVDARVRRELNESSWLEPHVRYYAQTQASFYRFGLVQGAPIPDLISADYRLGALRTVTLGATYGFKLAGNPGEWTARAEYMAQFGNGSPEYVTGVQRGFNLFPTLSIGSLVVGYTVPF